MSHSIVPQHALYITHVTAQGATTLPVLAIGLDRYAGHCVYYLNEAGEIDWLPHATLHGKNRQSYITDYQPAYDVAKSWCVSFPNRVAPMGYNSVSNMACKPR